jgi:hypothetical protein
LPFASLLLPQADYAVWRTTDALEMARRWGSGSGGSDRGSDGAGAGRNRDARTSGAARTVEILGTLEQRGGDGSNKDNEDKDRGNMDKNSRYATGGGRGRGRGGKHFGSSSVLDCLVGL